MKVSLEWLRELVDVHQPAEDLAEILTRGGIEVGGIDYLNQGIEKVVVGEITSMEHHPDADKLWICEVNLGDQKTTIVTGAQNLLLKDRIPVALPGTTLPNGVHIEVSKLRGVESSGMLCSTEELCLDADAGDPRSEDGIMILPTDTPLGTTMDTLFGQGDCVLDLELYPNRPDCLGMINVAREVSSLTGGELHLPAWAETEKGPDYPADPQAKIIIDDPELCHRYAGLVVEDVKIEPSPAWLQKRLKAAGVRPISNIVDITNYIMLEMGQPLHAFDRDAIAGAVHVRRAQSGEKLMTLDDAERELDSEMLLIADDEKALGLAGVMGGLNSEITDSTKRLFVESAHFSGVSIRRTSRRLGLRSEASNRFEKGVNPHGVAASLGRVAELVIELGAGKPVGFVEKISQLSEPAVVTLTVEKTNTLLGTQLTAEEITEVLKRLRFSYHEEAGAYQVEIPTYRADIAIEEDLIEEVARLTGYDRIPTTFPQGDQTQGRRTPEQEFRRKLRHLLIRLGLNEVMTYSFTRPDADRKFGDMEQAIPLLNPLREELSVMRTALLPSIMEIAARNIARRNLDIRLFELGSIYKSKERPLVQLPQEELHCAGVIWGKSPRHWTTPVTEYDFYTIKGIIEEIAREFGLELEFRVPQQAELTHPGRSAEIFLKGEKIGFMGEIHPALGKEWELERALIFELAVVPMMDASNRNIRAYSIPKFPAMHRDLAVVVPLEVSAQDVMKRIKALGGELLEQVDIFDVYTGKPIPEDRKSLAFTLKYQSLDRTLKDEEVNALNQQVLDGIEKEFGAAWRK
ncbi:phenylalanyl-tRNA synthetase, beta subunit [Desulfitobacterium dichloroeliminans LMG P-21439]|uniref:Phenylalanine--tRNA ligase beta subunit n=1 Tax=Desulfitobacterium dichloroeliminans (strain LMG P-21439 / DCA1) TaxID=871963 RepID=L0F1K8_DESDL|nr:phenylalanine--tRNA ligase subunit beta [Desulfitobacterium dichloroeliminans]AGA67739.1 phenylalanyl-tRNA synthetase, beta subunit [Desulfitobacterium dichloroeliminans LMG P-21439]